jgi:hypothetical protein
MHEANTQRLVYERDWNRSGQSDLPDRSPFPHLLGSLGQKCVAGITSLGPGRSLARASNCTGSRAAFQQFVPVQKPSSSISNASEVQNNHPPETIQRELCPSRQQPIAEAALRIEAQPLWILLRACAALVLLVLAVQQRNVSSLFRACRDGGMSLADEIFQWLCTFTTHLRPYRNLSHTRHYRTSQTVMRTSGLGACKLAMRRNLSSHRYT